ncbi:MAG: VWA domain-containing protein, partial [Rhodoferax sp.]|nr:VWA domain-containing protein [Rhodoferax sp.]
GLAPHESVNASLLAEYPLTMEILLTGDVARGAVHSPSHAIVTMARDDGTLVSLNRGGFLDRDLVLLVDGLQGKSFAAVVPDGDAFAVFASFCPEVKLQGRAPLRLKVLVDCSGSMAGDSIQAARSALNEVLKELEPADRISYSRFGSDVQHDTKALQPCDAATIQSMASLVAQTDADLGGTEMNKALLSTFELGAGISSIKERPTSQDGSPHTDVLLITDGEIWAVDEVLHSAEKSGHRVFAIGVGSAPAESLLRDLADKTGGACELVSPNQDLAAVIIRMFRRLRAPRSTGVTVNWGQEVLWQSLAPQCLFSGDTVHAFARLAQHPQRPPVLSWNSGESGEQACAAGVDTGAGDTLARMVGAIQLASLSRARSDVTNANTSAEALALALHYQLVTDQTNLILVHVRQDGQKAVGLPELEQIAPMQAAGWGAAGSVMPVARLALPLMPSFSRHPPSAAAMSMDLDDARFANAESPAAWRSVASASMIDSSVDAFYMADEIPAFLRKGDRPAVQVGTGAPVELLRRLEASALSIKGPLVWALELDSVGVPQSLAGIIEAMVLELGSREPAWGIVLHWLGQALAGEFTLSRQAARIVITSIKPVDAATLQRWTDAIALALGPVQANAWGKASAAA